jgi:hypothetical protein
VANASNNQLTAFLAIDKLSTYLMPPMAILSGALDNRDLNWQSAQPIYCTTRPIEYVVIKHGKERG